MFRLISLLAVLFVTSACGTVQNREFGLIEPAKLVIRSEILVGTTITVGDSSPLFVSKEDLTNYEMGILGAKDRENEMLQTLVIEITEGTQQVTIKEGQYILFDKKLYVGKGQTRELRVRK